MPPAGRSRAGHIGIRVTSLILISTCVTASTVSPAGAARTHQRPGPYDWPTYGHDAQHSFDGRTTLTPAIAPTLSRSWFYPTGDAVTATPTVVGGTVYVGSWDDYFYAVNLQNGALRWKTRLHSQNGVTPYPGQVPRDSSSDGGLVTGSAWYEPGSGSRPDLVIVGGGYTLYALDAHSGRIYWFHEYTGAPGRPADPSHDNARIFSSPVVFDNLVFFAVSADGQVGHRGYLVAADLSTGKPVWIDQTDVSTAGKVVNDGCGNIWSSGSIIPASQLIVFGTADCGFKNPPPFSEEIIAFHITTGKMAWQFRPPRPDETCDFDFGASVNVGLDRRGRARFLGDGSKDGSYYSLNPANGKLRWTTNVVFGGFAGGFIGSAAYDGARVYGSTAYGDFGRFEGPGMQKCEPGNPRDTATQEPSAHALDASSGSVVWEQQKSISLASTTVAGGMTFNGIAEGSDLFVRNAANGTLIADLPLAQECWSGIATVGNALVFGLGDSYTGTGSGIEVLTPGGAPPLVPR